MEFRPCIDIHKGKVKQIVGASLNDDTNMLEENFVADRDAAYFARLYRARNILGGHVIMLDAVDSEDYPKTKEQALNALRAYPDGLQAGGGITPDNAGEFIEAGASHVIVTSFVFRDGKINYDNLRILAAAVGKDHLVLDLSCRRKSGDYYIVTDRWQKFTNEKIDIDLLDHLSEYADEFLVHAVDMEGRSSGIEEDLAGILGQWDGIPITYAGGVGTFDDLENLCQKGNNHLNVTIGSALDIFGGLMSFEDVINWTKIRQNG